ncbi:MAG: GHKL domain-containing protein [Lachnospiraceae bacterium]|nr:GHKL domain-containing protein [Lachnospiraceae bacterium]
MWFLLDVLEYSIRGILLLYLCRNALDWKEKYVRQGSYLFFLLFVICGLWSERSELLKKIFYGGASEIQRSSNSIIRLVFVMVLLFILLDFFYEGSRLMKFYLLLLYQTVVEMARFGVHGVWSLCIEAYSRWQVERLLREEILPEHFMERMQALEYVWNAALSAAYLGIVWLTFYLIRKYRKDMRGISGQGILFLMLSPSVGMAFDLMLRCLFFTRTGPDMDLIYDRHSGMYAVIPLMTFLCILSTVCSIRIYEELMRAQEEKNGLFFYRQQLADMTGHVREMERLYDGIRGMRHDMNNYIADMEQLLGESLDKEQPGAAAGAEAHRYLYHMKKAMDTLTMRYQTGNPVMDVVMNRKWQECEKAGIGLDSDFLYPGQLGIEAFDLGILLNNALDNAIEACAKCRGKSGEIRVHSYQKGRMFFLQIENDCDGGSIRYTEGKMLQTTKEDDWIHGIGLRNMQSVVERYLGTMNYEIRDDRFFLTIMLQGRDDGIS